MVQNGVWFAGTSPFSWSVATTVPAVIYTIPATSPMHYVTYVRVYGSTPTVVYVGYTPGYYGTVLSSDGVVVYGTGYVLPALHRPVLRYPPPYYTYGYGAGFTVGFFFGFAMAGGWHGPCCYGGGGGVYISHHNNINVNNSYNRWGGKSTSISGPGGRNLKATQVGNTTFAKGSGSNNVYAGRDGNVYRRDEGGDWQKYDGKGDGWSDVGGNRPGRRSRPTQSLPAAQRPRRAIGRSRACPARRASRSTGSPSRARSARSAPSSSAQGGGFQGGGGMRGGRRRARRRPPLDELVGLAAPPGGNARRSGAAQDAGIWDRRIDEDARRETFTLTSRKPNYILVTSMSSPNQAPYEFTGSADRLDSEEVKFQLGCRPSWPTICSAATATCGSATRRCRSGSSSTARSRRRSARRTTSPKATSRSSPATTCSA